MKNRLMAATLIMATLLFTGCNDLTVSEDTNGTAVESNDTNTAV